jgi:hypothetical protein
LSNGPSQGQAQSAIHFAIPIRAQGSQFSEGPQQAPNQGSQQALQHKGAVVKFMDPSANGPFLVFFDGNQILNANFTPTWTTSSNPSPVLGPGPSGGPITLPDGGSISYTSEIYATEIDVAVSLTTTAGPLHTIGVVQTNGNCLDPDPCLSTQNGYVLAAGQVQFNLQPGNNNSTPIALTLQGVLQSGYICPTGTMPGGCTSPGIVQTMDAQGWYHVTAMPTDENGNTVIPQTKPTSWTPYLTAYGNGAWQFAELDGNGILDIQPDTVTVTGASPTTGNPGPNATPQPILRPSGLWWDGQYLKFRCAKIGTTTIGMKLMSPAQGSPVNVTGFSYNAPSNYPTAGALLGAVGSDTYYGNGEGVQVQCRGSGTIIVN